MTICEGYRVVMFLSYNCFNAFLQQLSLEKVRPEEYGEFYKGDCYVVITKVSNINEMTS